MKLSLSVRVAEAPGSKERVINTWAQGDVPHDPIRLQDPGGIDYPLIFRGLEEIGYNGYVTVHQAFTTIMEPENAVAQSYDYLTQIVVFEPR